MKQDAEQEKQTPPAPKKGMSDFKKAMMWTAISIVVLGVICLLSPWRWFLGLGGMSRGWSGVMSPLFGVGAGSVAAIIAAIVFGVRRKGHIAKGILAGLGIAVGIAIVALGITCFAVLASL